jgi:hypothetical protein
MTQPHTANPLTERSLRAPVLWGIVFGALQATAPLGFWWLAPATIMPFAGPDRGRLHRLRSR